MYVLLVRLQVSVGFGNLNTITLVKSRIYPKKVDHYRHNS